MVTECSVLGTVYGLSMSLIGMLRLSSHSDQNDEKVRCGLGLLGVVPLRVLLAVV